MTGAPAWTRATMQAALLPNHEAPDPMRQAMLIDAADLDLRRLAALAEMDAEGLPDRGDADRPGCYRTIPRATTRRWVTADLHRHLTALGLPLEPPAHAAEPSA